MREAHRLTPHSKRPARPATAISVLKARARALKASKQRTFPEARPPVKATIANRPFRAALNSSSNPRPATTEATAA
eukprot:5393361-Lingulodinium_polyedra.AAC.1